MDVTYGALAVGLSALTAYASSTETWRRPVEEFRYLMNFNQGLLERRQHELHAEGVRITFSGRRDWRVPKRVLRNMDEAAELTRRNKALTLNIAFNYGGRVSGCTVHFVDEQLDHGVIITQRTVPVLDTDDEPTLAHRILQQEHIAYSEAIAKVISGDYEIQGRRFLRKK